MTTMAAFAITIAIISFAIVVAAVLQFIIGQKPKYPENMYEVTRADGSEMEVYGYLQILDNGAITFLDTDGKHSESFSPTNWQWVVRIGEEGKA